MNNKSLVIDTNSGLGYINSANESLLIDILSDVGRPCATSFFGPKV
jgi:hypothetical protein